MLERKKAEQWGNAESTLKKSITFLCPTNTQAKEEITAICSLTITPRK